MRAVVQRVLQASVTVAGDVVGEIDRGLLVLLAIEKGDGTAQLEKMVNKTAGMHIFPDEAGRMNRSVEDIGGSILVVSQFTLVADMKKGYRPSFGGAAPPDQAREMVAHFCQMLESRGIVVAQGRFAADMRVALINDGPVTINLNIPPP